MENLTWVFRVPTVGEGRKNIRTNNGQRFPKFEKNHKLTDPRGSMNPKHKKHEENYSLKLLNCLKLMIKSNTILRSLGD